MSEPPPTTKIPPPPPPSSGYAQPPPTYGQPPPGYAQYPSGYGQPPPGYAQPYGYSQPVAVSGHAPVGINPFAGPGSAYKGFNGCCCGTVPCGAMIVVIIELIFCVLNIPDTGYAIGVLAQMGVFPVLLYWNIAQLVLTVANIVFSSGILATMNSSGWAGLWAPVGWVTVILLRFVSVIVLFILAAIYIPLIDEDPVLKAALYTGLVILIVVVVILFIPYIWFVIIMSGYICYKKKTGKGTTTVAAVSTPNEPEPPKAPTSV